MIKNDHLGWLLPLMAAVMLPSCSPKQEHAGALQGVVELDERDLGFEVGGRITSIDVKRGEVVHRGQVLAALDDTLERTARQGREAEARAAEAGLALLKAGSRPEEIRSAQAELRAAKRAKRCFRRTSIAKSLVRTRRGGRSVGRRLGISTSRGHRVATGGRTAGCANCRMVRAGRRGAGRGPSRSGE